MAREKKVVHAGVSREQMEQAFSEYAVADARLDRVNATLDVQITALRDKYADEINALVDRKDKAFDVLQAFAMENKDELFAKKKSLESIHGVLGFRTGQPKLKTLKGFTWSAVTSMLKEFLPAYVRISEEANKEKLISDRDEAQVSALFPKVGIAVVQDETFFVEPKKEKET